MSDRTKKILMVCIPVALVLCGVLIFFAVKKQAARRQDELQAQQEAALADLRKQIETDVARYTTEVISKPDSPVAGVITQYVEREVKSQKKNEILDDAQNESIKLEDLTPESALVREIAKIAADSVDTTQIMKALQKEIDQKVKDEMKDGVTGITMEQASLIEQEITRQLESVTFLTDEQKRLIQDGATAAAIANLQNTLNSLQKQINDLKTAQAQLKNGQNGTNGTNGANGTNGLNATVSALQNSITTLQQKYDEKLNAVTRENTELRNTLVELRTSKTTTETSIQKQLEEQIAALKKLQDEYGTSSSTVTELLKTLETVREQIVKQESSGEKSDEELKKQAEELAKLAEKYTKTQEDLAKANDANEKLEEILKKLQDGSDVSIKDITKELEALKKELGNTSSGYTNDIQALIDQLNSNSSQIQQLKNSLQSVIDQTKALIESERKNINDAITYLEGYKGNQGDGTSAVDIAAREELEKAKQAIKYLIELNTGDPEVTADLQRVLEEVNAALARVQNGGVLTNGELDSIIEALRVAYNKSQSATNIQIMRIEQTLKNLMDAVKSGDEDAVQKAIDDALAALNKYKNEDYRRLQALLEDEIRNSGSSIADETKAREKAVDDINRSMNTINERLVKQIEALQGKMKDEINTINAAAKNTENGLNGTISKLGLDLSKAIEDSIAAEAKTRGDQDTYIRDDFTASDNAIMETIANALNAEKYNSSNHYQNGDYVIINNTLYQITDENGLTGTLTEEDIARLINEHKLTPVDITTMLDNLQDLTKRNDDALLQTIEKSLNAETYNPSKTYNKGSLILYKNVMYRVEKDGLTGEMTDERIQQLRSSGDLTVVDVKKLLDDLKQENSESDAAIMETIANALNAKEYKPGVEAAAETYIIFNKKLYRVKKNITANDNLNEMTPEQLKEYLYVDDQGNGIDLTTLLDELKRNTEQKDADIEQMIANALNAQIYKDIPEGQTERAEEYPMGSYIIYNKTMYRIKQTIPKNVNLTPENYATYLDTSDGGANINDMLEQLKKMIQGGSAGDFAKEAGIDANDYQPGVPLTKDSYVVYNNTLYQVQENVSAEDNTSFQELLLAQKLKEVSLSSLIAGLKSDIQSNIKVYTIYSEYGPGDTNFAPHVRDSGEGAGTQHVDRWMGTFATIEDIDFSANRANYDDTMAVNGGVTTDNTTNYDYINNEGNLVTRRPKVGGGTVEQVVPVNWTQFRGLVISYKAGTETTPPTLLIH